VVVALLRGCSLDEVARLLSDYREAQQHHTDARVLALGLRDPHARVAVLRAFAEAGGLQNVAGLVFEVIKRANVQWAVAVGESVIES
jgi:hypothetical protein